MQDLLMKERNSNFCVKFMEVKPILSTCKAKINPNPKIKDEMLEFIFWYFIERFMFLGRPLPSVFWLVDDQQVHGKTHIEPGKDVVVNKLKYNV